MASDNKHLQEIVSFLPNSPGVYQFLNSEGKVIYVGKAKDLKKRVSSYFTARANESRKLQVMVRKIADIKPIVVNTEADALLLENNLIKKLQPRYNVMLKDDKTYPWICVKNEHFPRIFSTRKLLKDGSKYFGPYTSTMMVRMILELIRELYPLRTCKLALTKANIEKGKFKPCLEYHIGNCKAPCIGLENEEEYNKDIEMAVSIIKGNTGIIIQTLKERMKEASDNLQFEEAQKIKDKLDSVERYQSKSIIVNPLINNIDVFTLIIDNTLGYANFLRIVRGAIVQSHTMELKLGIEEDKESLLSYVIAEMHSRLGGLSKEILVPFLPDQELPNTTYTIPQRGDKFKLLELSERNAKHYRFERLKQLEKTNPEKHTERILTTIQKDLNLKELPVHIECFDNSNIQGTNPVAACVVFKNAKPSKKDYRHFNIKTVEGPNDFASMEEIVYRRYHRLLMEEQPLPQLIVIDGGKGQLKSAYTSLQKLHLNGQIAIIGLAERLEEIYFPNDSVPLFLDKNSESLKVIMHLRDEAHRFGITFHRNKRSKAFINTELGKISGVGEKSVEKLFTHFKAISKIKAATKDELQKVVGAKIALQVYQYFHPETERGILPE